MQRFNRKQKDLAPNSTIQYWENSDVSMAVDKKRLQTYIQAKLQLAELLRHAVETLAILGVNNQEKAIEELIVKLAENRFVLAVVGQFKRGKSSLMNAIIAQNLLPTGVLPITSAITTLKYGPSERFTLYRQTAVFGDELPLSFLSEYITEENNPRNVKKVKSATVELPLPLLRQGIEFVDTPGIGSTISENTNITYNFIPQCDAIIFVTGVDSPMSNSEVEFLKSIPEYVNRIFYVINKVDLLTQHEQTEMLRYVETTIQENTGDHTPRIFPISAANGLKGKLSKDHTLYESSRLQELEDALTLFLTNEKGNQFLTSIAQKALKIMNSEEASQALTQEALQHRVDTLTNEISLNIQHNPFEAAAAVKNIKDKLLRFSNRSAEQDSTSALKIQPITRKKFKKAKAIADTNVNLTSNKIALSYQGRGCPACQYLAGVASDFFAQWQYLLSSNEKVQNSFAVELGFCPQHTWQLLAYSSPRGASIGFTKFAELLANRLRSNKTSMAELIKNIDDCRVCRLMQEEEKKIIHQLSTNLYVKHSILEYKQSDGLCLHHVTLLVAHLPEEKKEQLLTDMATRFEESAEDMQEYVLKYDATRRNLINKNENEAYLTVVKRIAGERDMLFPWKKIEH